MFIESDVDDLYNSTTRELCAQKSTEKLFVF